MPRRTLRVHERTIELAAVAERTRQGRLMNPLRLLALEVAAELTETPAKTEKLTPPALGA